MINQCYFLILFEGLSPHSLQTWSFHQVAGLISLQEEQRPSASVICKWLRGQGLQIGLTSAVCGCGIVGKACPVTTHPDCTTRSALCLSPGYCSAPTLGSSVPHEPVAVVSSTCLLPSTKYLIHLILLCLVFPPMQHICCFSPYTP